MSTEICTSIEQSKKLLSLGLDPSTADMWYSYYGNSKYNLTIAYKGQQWFLCQIRNSLHDDIPCWSFTALLELMPIGSHIEKKNSGYACYVVYTKPLEASTPIEAAFEMICRLIEQGYIKVKK